MRVLGKNKILKVKKKNIGNKKLCNAIDELISDLEGFEPDKKPSMTLEKTPIVFIIAAFTFLT